MKKILLTILCAFILMSCDNVYYGRKAYKEYLKSRLKDPNSLIIYNEEYKKIDEIECEWTIDYGAKNSYGAMVRETIVLTTLGKDPEFVHEKKDY